MRLIPSVLIALAAAILLMIPIRTFVSTVDAISLTAEDAPEAPVAIVFGAGLRRDGKPSDVLRDRLSVAAELYKIGKVKRILVSGDNRFENYNEPQAMNDALVEDFGVDPGAIAIDYAGRRTYDTCARAQAIWGIEQAILVSQKYHLPRAIWTCERLGIRSSGVSASLQPYVKETSFVLREIPAILRAWWDVYVVPPEYVEGEFEEDLAA
ncbi:MAG TPA: ElyC/SanA/YdcF family protein [Candidatus Baltobacteraceae bacterium]|nr:ElyC/SanA/YdcF family protein [Candidatus Baltobacteraceae bacterium]